MVSFYISKKKEAITLRQKGKSIVEIGNTLGVPRSTLSGWFKNVSLSKKQTDSLEKNKQLALVKARLLASLRHKSEKIKRIENASQEAGRVLASIVPSDLVLLEVALAFLYLGEGSKNNTMSLGNSNPQILKFYLTAIDILYGIKRDSLSYYLHLRADQDSNELVSFWSKELSVNKDCFKGTSVDKRTVNSPTLSGYKGVCVAAKGNMKVLRRILEISAIYSTMIIQKKGD